MAMHQSRFEIELTDCFLAPWGLPSETRPLHVIWEGEPDAIQIGFVEPVEVLNIHNTMSDADSYSDPTLVDGDVKSFEIPCDELEVGGYLSAEFKVPKTFDEVMVGQKVAAAFIKEGERIDKWEDYTFTIRPKIECVGAPDSISLSSDEPINIDMQYVGFGMAEVKVEAEAEGEIISEHESIYHDILDRLIETEIHKKNSERFEETLEEWEESENFEEEKYEEFVSEFRESLQSREEFEEFEREELEEIAKILREGDEDKETLGVYKAIELLLMNSIIDMVDRHPTENIKLDNPKTKISFDTEVNSITVFYHLRDVEGNRYDSLQVTIEVEDGQKDKFDFSREIETNWENIQLDPDEERDNALERIDTEI